MPSQIVAELEASAQKAQAVLRRRNARVRQAKKEEQDRRQAAVLALLEELGLLALDLPTLREMLTPLAGQITVKETEARSLGSLPDSAP